MMRDEGKLLSGFEMKVRPEIFIGAAENPFADPFEIRVLRLAKKVAAGAQFIQTQCIYNMEKFKKWMQGVVDRGLDEHVSILAGLTPMKGVGMARYMKSKVPGMDVPDEIIKRLSGVPEGQAGRRGHQDLCRADPGTERGQRCQGLSHHGHRMGRKGPGNSGAHRALSTAASGVELWWCSPPWKPKR